MLFQGKRSSSAAVFVLLLGSVTTVTTVTTVTMINGHLMPRSMMSMQMYRALLLDRQGNGREVWLHCL